MRGEVVIIIIILVRIKKRKARRAKLFQRDNRMKKKNKIVQTTDRQPENQLLLSL
jgi:hypothetical protein